MRDGIGQQCFSGLGILPQQFAGCGKREGLTGELGVEAVMEITAQAASFFLACGDQSFTGALQVNREAHCVGGDTRLPGQVIEQMAVGGGKRFAWAACSRVRVSLPSAMRCAA